MPAAAGLRNCWSGGFLEYRASHASEILGRLIAWPPNVSFINFPTLQLSNFPTFASFQFPDLPILQFSSFSSFPVFEFSIFRSSNLPIIQTQTHCRGDETSQVQCFYLLPFFSLLCMRVCVCVYVCMRAYLQIFLFFPFSSFRAGSDSKPRDRLFVFMFLRRRSRQFSFFDISSVAFCTL